MSRLGSGDADATFIKASGAVGRAPVFVTNRLGIKIHATVQISGGDHLAQSKIIAGPFPASIKTSEIFLAAINGVGLDDKCRWKFATVDRLGDILDRIKGLATKTPPEVTAESLHIAANGKIAFNGLNHNTFSSRLGFKVAKTMTKSRGINL